MKRPKRRGGGKGPVRRADVDYEAVTMSGNGTAVRVFSNDRGTPERRRHDTVEVVKRDAATGEAKFVRISASQIIESAEGSRRLQTVKCSDTISRLQANGTITAAMAAAAYRFQADFYRAALDTLRAMPMERQAKGHGGSEAVLLARHRVGEIVDRLGGHNALTARALWFVVGVGDSIKDWARRERIGGGRALNERAAKGILIAALEVLAARD